MATGYNSWEQFYNRFNTIFHGIVALSLLPFAYVFLETQKEFARPSLVEDSQILLLQIVIGIVAAAAVYYARSFQKGIAEAIAQSLPLKEKLELYLNRKLVQYAILQVAAVAGMVGLYLTSSHFFTIIYIAVLFVYSLGRPTYDLVVGELRLSKEEEAKLKSGSFD